ncbi:UNVERIFIED_CONTAM: hypothetical protein Sradi_7230100 [Sesamum radiatum]|uniref:Uncharacterized protein n=1 Tax=Sesamum radiatum TaxID=300843 RepID=A0AAW2INI9_SESRA
MEERVAVLRSSSDGDPDGGARGRLRAGKISDGRPVAARRRRGGGAGGGYLLRRGESIWLRVWWWWVVEGLVCENHTYF